MKFKNRKKRFKLLCTHPVEWFKTRKASVWTRKKEFKDNTQYFLGVPKSDRPALLKRADRDLTSRQKTAAISFIVGGVLAGVCADLLANHWGNVPRPITTLYTWGLILQLVAIFPALTELFRWAPTVTQQTQEEREKQARHTPAPQDEHSLTTRLEAMDYAEMQQRVFHLQRNMYRFRCFTALAMVVLSYALFKLNYS